VVDHRPPTRRAAHLSIVLAAALFVALAHLVSRHFDVRVDLSQDRLSGWSPAALRVIERLDDTLAIELFVTARPQLAAAQLHRRRLMDRFDELAAESRGRVEIVVSDPSESYADRLRAERLGITPIELEDFSGTSLVRQDVWFAAVLRHRGREQVLGFLHPLTLEYDVASAAARLASARRTRLGWLVGEVPGDVPGADGATTTPDAGFTVLRRHLERRFQVVDVYGLDSGVTLPEDLDALVCLAPRELGPRAVFEIEDFVHGGGALVVLADRSRASQAARRIDTYATGLEALFEAWGAPHTDAAVWDRVRPTKIQITSAAEGGAARTSSVDFPFWPTILSDGLSETSPVTARMRMVALRWAHPFLSAEPVEGLARTSLVRTSDAAFATVLEPLIRVDGASIDGTTKELIAAGRPAVFDLALALEGTFPTLFGDNSPPAIDHTSGAGVAGTERTRTSGAARAARVVLVGDSDFARDEVIAAPDGGLAPIGRAAALLLENCIDWVALDDELAVLRMRAPKDRRLVDFDARAALAEGVEQAEGLSGRTAAAERAKASAAGTRRLWTFASLAGSLLLVGVLVAVAIARRRRAPLVVLERGGRA
jgi:ABC-type uncharacterized transport system involved in gliding motility auxiliary subunit